VSQLHFSHHVGRADLQVRVGSSTLAMALNARVAALPAHHLHPVIARVLDELGLGDEMVFLDRIEVDLGRLPPEGLEQAAAERLYPALKSALSDALARRRQSAETPVSLAEAQLAVIRGYLLTGSLPGWAPETAKAGLGSYFGAVIGDDPGGMTDLVLDLGRRAPVRERLAAQFADPELEHLIETLEPRHAAVIVAYLADLRRLHRHRPLVPVADPALRRIGWTITLGYLVQRSGSRFNRKSFLKSQLAGYARGGGIAYPDLLRTLDAALIELRGSVTISASLPAVLAELLAEAEIAPAKAPPPARPTGDAMDRAFWANRLAELDRRDALAFFLRHGRPPWAPTPATAQAKNSSPDRAARLADLARALTDLPDALLKSALARLPHDLLVARLARLFAALPVTAQRATLWHLVPALAGQIMPINNYILATAPLGETAAEALIAQHRAVSDTRFVINYYRLSADHRLLFGGGESYRRRFPADLRRFIQPYMLAVFPQLADTPIDYAWGGTLAITRTRLPCFGRTAGEVYYALGFSGQGVALGSLAGELIAEALAGQAERFDLMASLPTPRFPGGTLLRWPGLVLGMLYYGLRDRL